MLFSLYTDLVVYLDFFSVWFFLCNVGLRKETQSCERVSLPDGIFPQMPFIFAWARRLSPEPIQLIYGCFLLVNVLWI